MPVLTPPEIFRSLDMWFAARGWTAFDFQKQAWADYLAGKSGLVHAPTGSGKTLAVFGGPLTERLSEGQIGKRTLRGGTEPLRILWLTPMRALAADTTHALKRAIDALGLNWSVELRTSDTTQATRKKQRERLPTVLVTTPESLSVLLSYPDSREHLSNVRAVIADEWHELLSTKRGVQAELGIGRLRHWNPALRTWGLSATLANLDQARAALVGHADGEAVLVQGHLDKAIVVESLLPESIEKFPWGGHMGLRMLDQVIAAVDAAGSSLVFTNTRAQAEIWYRAIIEKKPGWLGAMAVHHGSLDRKLRQEIEGLLRDGRLKAVVCTSSLDLGVDFASVDRVIQVGSPKGVGRLMQRAGRSGHRPGEVSRVLCAPTHAFELIEFSAAREGIEHRRVEPRVPLNKPLDVLAQHIVTLASGGGFDEPDLLSEVRKTHAYRDLTDLEWQWTMDFCIRGGPTLRAYPRFARIRLEDDGLFHVASESLARMHRIGIGTITSDGVMQIVMTSGKKLGTIEESYISKVRPGDTFVFAGRSLEMVSMRQMVVRCRPATQRRGSVPSWPGGKFPLSTQLSDGVRLRLEEAREDLFRDIEMQTLRPLLKLQQRWSAIPARDELLIEKTHSREGCHNFVYCFLGRLVHEGLGAMIGYRMRRMHDVPVTATFNDYGIELLTPADPLMDEAAWRAVLSPENVLDDLLACLNSGELTKRQFREIARVAGLVLATVPGAPRSVRALQASTELFFDVFTEFDPENLLLKQAQREVLEQQLEINRLTNSLRQLGRQRIVMIAAQRFTPMAFPIWAQRIGSQTVRVEAAGERIQRMVELLEREAAKSE